MVGHGAPMYHLPGNVISTTVGFVYINLQPEYDLPSSTRFGHFRKFSIIGVGGATSSPATPKEKLLLGVRILVCGYLRVRFDLPSSINFRDISGFPKLGLYNLY